MKSHITLILMLAIILTGSCDTGPDYQSDYADSPLSPKGGVSYEGEWSIGGYRAGTGAVTVYPSGFAFEHIPYAAILRMALPHSSVDSDDTPGYMVPVSESGTSEQAVYMQVNSEQWTTHAVIDGQEVTATLFFPTLFDTTHDHSFATFSRLSGTYAITFQIVRTELTNNNGDIIRTADTPLTVKFVTTRRIKQQNE